MQLAIEDCQDQIPKNNNKRSASSVIIRTNLFANSKEGDKEENKNGGEVYKSIFPNI